MTKTILGHIDCPTCGTVKGMRITLDKNEHPFGFCEAECGQQLRVGGDLRRVRQFVERYPWAAAIPVTVTEPLQEPAPVPAPAAPRPAAPAPAPAPRPAAKPVSKPAAPAPTPAPAPKAGFWTPIMGARANG